MQIALPKWIFRLFGRTLLLSGRTGNCYASIHGFRTYSWFSDTLYTGNLDPARSPKTKIKRLISPKNRAISIFKEIWP